MRRKFRVKKLIIILFLLVLAFIFIYPLIFVIFGSLKSGYELSESLKYIFEGGGTGFIHWDILPQCPTMKHIVEILFDSPGYFVMFWNSMRIVFGVLIGQIIIGLPCAWGFARCKFKFKYALFAIYVLLMLLPFQVLMLSEYLVIDKLGLLNTLWSLIIPGAFSTFPVFIMYHYFKGVPEEIIESAKVDGANEFQVFLYIGLPQGLTGIISALVLSFLEYWNLIEQPITFIKSASKMPLSLYLPEITSKNIGGALVVSLLTLLPPLLVFLCGQKYLEKGIQTMNRS